MVSLSPAMKDKIAWIFVLICPACFASNMLIARGMSGVFPPLSMAFGRWFLVGLVVCVCLAAMRRLSVQLIRAEWKSLLFLAALGMGLCGGPVYLAGELTTAVNIGLIYSAAPLVIALIGFVYFGERLSSQQIFGLLIGLIGVVIIIIKADVMRLTYLQFNGGDLWIVLATISFAIYSLGLKHIPSKLSQIQRFGAMAFGGALWHLPFMMAEIALRGPLPEITFVIVGAFMILVFIASLASYLSYGFIVSRHGAVIAGTTLYLAPIYAAILAVILLDERIEMFHLIGGALILPGLWLVSQKQR